VLEARKMRAGELPSDFGEVNIWQCDREIYLSDPIRLEPNDCRVKMIRQIAYKAPALVGTRNTIETIFLGDEIKIRTSN
jgi:hypothetical protein